MMGGFDAGVTALMAQQEMLGAISQNVANARTVGYRKVEVEFSSLVSQSSSGGFHSSGVRSRVHFVIDGQGSIESTQRPLDLAIIGRGFFVYSSEPSGSGDIYYSRDGQLRGAHVNDLEGGALTAFEHLYLMAWEIDSAGDIVGGELEDMVSIPATLNEPFPGRITTSGELSMVLPATGSTFEQTQIHYFDASGDQHSMTLEFTWTANQTWDLQAYDEAGAPLGGVETLTFDGAGALSSSATISVGGLFTLDVSNITQRGSVVFRGLYTQDGLGQGTFVEYILNEDGIVNGRFSSGAITPLYQIPLATFGNPDQLTEQSDNLWVESENSGEVSYQSLSDTAQIQIGALELGNAEIADSFTQMIFSQRAYASAAQLIKATDEMLQTARDLKR
jgi:flagellar hook protein FlgE